MTDMAAEPLQSGPTPITTLDLLAEAAKGRGLTRGWTIRYVGGHRMNAMVSSKDEPFIATVAADLLSSPTNGTVQKGSLVDWPAEVGAPLRSATNDDALEHWKIAAAFYAGPQAPGPDGTWGPEWVVESISVIDPDKKPEVDRFTDDGVLVHCAHGEDHAALGECGCADRCCEHGHLREADLDAMDVLMTTASGTRYAFVRSVGAYRIPAGGEVTSGHLYRNARVSPSVIRIGVPGTRLDTWDEWVRPRPAVSLRALRDDELEELGVERE